MLGHRRTSGNGVRGAQRPSNRGLEQSQQAGKLGRLEEDRQQAPDTWCWVNSSAGDLISHGKTSCWQQSATWAIRGKGDVRDFMAGPIAPLKQSGSLKPTAMASEPTEPGV